jgi:hypothetical protein
MKGKLLILAMLILSFGLAAQTVLSCYDVNTQLQPTEILTITDKMQPCRESLPTLSQTSAFYYWRS